MPRKTEYELVSAKTAKELKKKVLALLEEGWTLSGELVFGADEFVRELTKSIRPGVRARRVAAAAVKKQADD